MRKLIFAALCGLGLISTTIRPQRVHATSPQFSVEAVLPSNQINTAYHYFDLAVAPATHQSLTIKIINNDTGSHRFSIQTNRATTTSSGQLDYTKHGSKSPASLQNDIEHLMPKPQTVTVAPRSIQRVQLSLHTPTQAWHGIILGAIQVKQADQESQSGVSGRVSYSLGVQLQNTKTLPKMSPQLSFHGVAIQSKAQGSIISAKLENPAPMIQENLTVTSTVIRNRDHKMVQHATRAGLRVAPNSLLTLPVKTKPQALGNGTYTLTVVARNGTVQWRFTKKFMVQERLTPATTTHPQPLTQLRQLPAWLIILAIGILILLTAIVTRLIRKARH